MVIRALRTTWRRWRDWRWRVAAMRELRALDDRTLKDMGLTRGEIRAAVDGQIDGRETVRPHRSAPARRPPAAATGPAEQRHHLDRARQLRVEFVAGLVRRGFRRLARLLRRRRADTRACRAPAAPHQPELRSHPRQECQGHASDRAA